MIGDPEEHTPEKEDVIITPAPEPEEPEDDDPEDQPEDDGGDSDQPEDDEAK